MAYTPVQKRTQTVTGAPLPPTTSPTMIPPKEAKARYVPVSQRTQVAPVQTPQPVPTPTPTQPEQPGYFSPSPEGVRARDIARELPGSIKEMATRIYQGIREPIVNPTPQQREYEERFIPTPAPGALEIATQPGRAAAKVITRFLNPALQPLAEDIAGIKATNELVPVVESGKMPASVFDEIAVLHKTSPQIAGDVAQTVLSAYAGSQVPRIANQAGKETVRQAFNQGAKTGVEVGALFGGATAASSGSKDTAEILQIIADSSAGGGLLGGITAGIIPVSRETYLAAKKAKIEYDKIPNKQGGFAAFPKRKDVNEVNIDDLNFNPDDLAQAKEDAAAGVKSMTDGPIIVERNPETGKYDVLDGSHRVQEALARGESTIPAEIQERKTPETKALEKEAKKYKTAEEYFKNNLPTERIEKTRGFLTTDGKVLDMGTGQHPLIMKEAGLNVSTDELVRNGTIRLRNTIGDDGFGEINIQIGKAPTLQQMEALKQLPENIPINYDFTVGEKMISSPANGATKKEFLSQLTDIWKEANAQNAPQTAIGGEKGPIPVQTKKAVPGALAEAKARGYTSVAKRKAPEVERSSIRLEELAKDESIDQSVRRLEESAGEIEPGTPRTLDEYDRVPSAEKESRFDKLPKDLQDKIIEREMKQIYDEEIAPLRSENPVIAAVDEIISGRRKILSTDRFDPNLQKGKRMVRGDMSAEIREGLPRKLSSKIFTKDTSASSFDEIASDTGVSTGELLAAIQSRYEERIELRKSADAAKAEAKAKAKSFAEEKKLLRDLQSAITREILRKRYSVGEKLKFEARAEKRGIKKGIVKGLEGKEEIRQKELAKRQALRDKIHEITHTHSTRAAKVKAIAEFFSLTDKELRQTLGNRDYRIMTEPDFEGFLKSLYGKAEEVKNKSEARQRLDFTIIDKELGTKKDPYSNVTKLRQALKLPTIDKMSTIDLVKFEEILSQYEQGDVFLSTRQIETIDNTELTGIRTMREARERLAERTGKPIQALGQVHIGELDHFLWDTALAEQSPWHQVIVEDTVRSELEGDMRYYEIDQKVNDLIRKARASRTQKGIKEKVKQALAPTDKMIFEYLEATPEDKVSLAKDLTKPELEAAKFIEDRYAEMRDYLLKKRVIEHARSNYVTHIRRGFLEALFDERSRRDMTPAEAKKQRNFVFRKLREKFGDKNKLVQALEEITEKKEQESAIFNILDQDTGEVLPLEKFFQYSLSRTGGLVPTRNMARAFLSYTRAFEKKRSLDAIIPKLVVYTKAFTPKELTPRGLEFDRSLKRFFNEWMNTKKGRTTKAFLKQGSNLDIMVRGGQAMTRIIDLGFSIPGGLASYMGEQTATYTNLGAKKYQLGQVRAKTKKGIAIAKKYENFTGRTPWDSMHEQSKGLTDKIWEGMFAFYRDSYARANKHHLLGSLTPEEWKTGEVSAEKLTELRLEMGRYRAIEGASSIFGATTEGKILTQYKSWAISPLKTNLQNLNKLARAIAKKDTTIIKSREFQELFRVTQIGLAVGLMAYAIGSTDPKDKSLFATLKRKIVMETMSLISVLDPSTLSSVPRLAGFVTDIGQAVHDLIVLEEKKSTGELKGLADLQKILTPRLIKQFTPAPAPKSTRSGGGGSVNIGGKAIPKLPSLPGLPPLPKL